MDITTEKFKLSPKEIENRKAAALKNMIEAALENDVLRLEEVKNTGFLFIEKPTIHERYLYKEELEKIKG